MRKLRLKKCTTPKSQRQQMAELRFEPGSLAPDLVPMASVLSIVPRPAEL